MQTNTIENIIDLLDEPTLKQDAIFGLFQYGGGVDESFIRANKEGLALFAVQLLKAINEKEKPFADGLSNIRTLDHDEDWVDHEIDIFLQYIELVSYKQQAKADRTLKNTLVNKIVPYSCALIAIILIIATIIGLITMFKSIF
jgi:hypothetical protein